MPAAKTRRSGRELRGSFDTTTDRVGKSPPSRAASSSGHTILAADCSVSANFSSNLGAFRQARFRARRMSVLGSWRLSALGSLRARRDFASLGWATDLICSRFRCGGTPDVGNELRIACMVPKCGAPIDTSHDRDRWPRTSATGSLAEWRLSASRRPKANCVLSAQQTSMTANSRDGSYHACRRLPAKRASMDRPVPGFWLILPSVLAASSGSPPEGES
jgi:hypothetical protein